MISTMTPSYFSRSSVGSVRYSLFHWYRISGRERFLNAQSAASLHVHAMLRMPMTSPRLKCVLQDALKVGAFWWLRQLLVRRSCHVTSDLDQDGLHSEFALPHTDARELG